MSHTIREKTKLLNRIRRIRGQVEAIERALEEEVGCADVLQRITSCRGAMNGLLGYLTENCCQGDAAACGVGVCDGSALINTQKGSVK